MKNYKTSNSVSLKVDWIIDLSAFDFIETECISLWLARSELSVLSGFRRGSNYGNIPFKEKVKEKNSSYIIITGLDVGL